MKAIICVTAAVSLAALLSGCSTLLEAKDATTELAGSLYAPKHYLDENFEKELSKLKLGGAMTDAERDFLFTQVNLINRNYARYVAILTSGKAAVNVSYDSLNLALTGGAAVATPAVTKTGLAALSTFFQGQKQSIDKNVFNDQTIFALTSIMEIRRTVVVTKIRKSTDDPSYTLGSALIDLDELYRAGSMQNALQASFLNQAPSNGNGVTPGLLPPTTNQIQ